jgi:hypothetical protein
MKKLTSTLVTLVTAMFLLGCVAAIGNRDATRGSATLGQQLVDLQKAKDAGAITESEYAVQKAKLLGK